MIIIVTDMFRNKDIAHILLMNIRINLYYNSSLEEYPK